METEDIDVDWGGKGRGEEGRREEKKRKGDEREEFTFAAMIR